MSTKHPFKNYLSVGGGVSGAGVAEFVGRHGMSMSVRCVRRCFRLRLEQHDEFIRLLMLWRRCAQLALWWQNHRRSHAIMIRWAITAALLAIFERSVGRVRVSGFEWAFVRSVICIYTNTVSIHNIHRYTIQGNSSSGTLNGEGPSGSQKQDKQM